MSISCIRLQNFRGFHDARLPLKPLTVLLGPNSAGKSSFGHALVALRQVHERALGDPNLCNPGAGDNPWPVDLGNYAELAHVDETGPVRIALEIGSGWIELGFGGATSEGDRLDGLPLTFLSLPGKAVATLGLGGPSAPGTGANVLVVQSIGPAESGVPALHAARTFRRRNRATWQTDSAFDAQLVFQGLRVLTAVEETTRTQVSFPENPLNDVASFLTGLRYLRPIRMDPRRIYAPAPTGVTGLGASGEWTADFLLRHKAVLVPSLLPGGAPATPEAALAQRRTAAWQWDGTEAPLGETVARWMSRLGLATAVEARAEGRDARLDVRLAPGLPPRALTDLGFGLSQVLPILIDGLMLPWNGCLIVEQPEAQLHPRAQAELADFFCALVCCGRTALVETHSEAFFHRLRLRAAMDDELAARIAVYFLDPPSQGRCAEPRPIPLSEDGELRWPEGFLSEGLDAELAIRAARAARWQEAQRR